MRREAQAPLALVEVAFAFVAVLAIYSVNEPTRSASDAPVDMTMATLTDGSSAASSTVDGLAVVRVSPDGIAEVLWDGQKVPWATFTTHTDKASVDKVVVVMGSAIQPSDLETLVQYASPDHQGAGPELSWITPEKTSLSPPKETP